MKVNFMWSVLMKNEGKKAGRHNKSGAKNANVSVQGIEGLHKFVKLFICHGHSGL